MTMVCEGQIRTLVGKGATNVDDKHLNRILNMTDQEWIEHTKERRSMLLELCNNYIMYISMGTYADHLRSAVHIKILDMFDDDDYEFINGILYNLDKEVELPIPEPLVYNEGMDESDIVVYGKRLYKLLEEKCFGI